MNIAIIPARSGSKRIKNKNITKFYGKPLIFYTIKTAIKSKCNYTLDNENNSAEKSSYINEGFDTYSPYNNLNKKEWRGKLQKRDSETIYLNCKGKIVSIPRSLVVQVQLTD